MIVIIIYFIIVLNFKRKIYFKIIINDNPFYNNEIFKNKNFFFIFDTLNENSWNHENIKNLNKMTLFPTKIFKFTLFFIIIHIIRIEILIA